MSTTTVPPAITGPRTHAEAMLDASYGVVHSRMCSRWYELMDIVLGAVQVFGSSAVFVAVLQQLPGLASACALLVALAGVFSVLVAPGRRCERFAQLMRDFGALHSRGAALPLDALDAELRVLQSREPAALRWLSAPAYNANLLTHGQDQWVMPMNVWQRTISALL